MSCGPEQVCLEIPGLGEEVDVEESLSPRSLSRLQARKSLLEERMLNSSMRNMSGLPSVPLRDYTEIDLPRYMYVYVCVYVVLYTEWQYYFTWAVCSLMSLTYTVHTYMYM